MDVLCPLGYKEMSLAGDLENLARARKDLAGHKERDELLGHLPEIHIPAGEVILMATVGIAHGIGIVLKDENLSRETFLPEALLRNRQAALQ